ncbi:hypothetical protein H5410_005187 [Solanum commersonii]|uniref:Uncharacterized protein n=1 Tax=Solanum commersonii TaxID=4109 RepID=A0A9J6A5Z4_SOLCO|nr:hypothetical protein H5410_005187 [Solanum commersonii]
MKSFLKHGGLECGEEDCKIFEFLSSIKLELSQDVKSAYNIILNFDSNAYFENTKLWKRQLIVRLFRLGHRNLYFVLSFLIDLRMDYIVDKPRLRLHNNNTKAILA